MKILVTYDMFREGFTELESKYEVTFPEGRDFTYEEVFEMIPEYDVLCSMFDFPVNKELIDHASKLRLIANYAVGYNNIDVVYALEKGLTVANTPDPVTAPTANIALGLMLDTARRITECDRKLRTLGKDMKVGVLENLGIYEVVEEDFALCEFVDPSKTEMQQIIRDGINLMIKEA